MGCYIFASLTQKSNIVDMTTTIKPIPETQKKMILRVKYYW